MGLPKFPDSQDIPSRDEAINAILISIAMEEMALSKIITAESEKIQLVIDKALQNPEPDMCMILRVNKSAESMLDKINDMQILLKSKLRIASEFLPEPPCPPDPPVPPIPPKPEPCTAVFMVPANYCWNRGLTLQLKEYKHCDNIKLGVVDCNKVILLPPGKTYQIALKLEMINASGCPASVKMVLGHGPTNDLVIGSDHDKTVVSTKEYAHCGTTSQFNIDDTVVWKTSGAWVEHFLAFHLRVPDWVKVLGGKISVTETV